MKILNTESTRALLEVPLQEECCLTDGCVLSEEVFMIPFTPLVARTDLIESLVEEAIDSHEWEDGMCPPEDITLYIVFDCDSGMWDMWIDAHAGLDGFGDEFCLPLELDENEQELLDRMRGLLTDYEATADDEIYFAI